MIDSKRMIYTPKEVADILRVSRYTVYKWIKEGKVPAFKLSRKGKGGLLIPADFLHSLFNQNLNGGAEE